MMQRYILAPFALAAIVTPVAVQAADAARAPIQALDDALLASMKAGSGAGIRGRSAIVAPAVDRSFDIPLMTRLAVGASWNSMSASDQAALVAAFRRLTIANYADNFDGYSGESFAIDDNIQQRGTDKLVRTTLNIPKKSPVAISYRLRSSGGSWKIIDVYYNNAVSQLATRRADFASVLQKGGAKALVSHLDALSAKAGG